MAINTRASSEDAASYQDASAVVAIPMNTLLGESILSAKSYAKGVWQETFNSRLHS